MLNKSDRPSSQLAVIASQHCPEDLLLVNGANLNAKNLQCLMQYSRSNECRDFVDINISLLGCMSFHEL